MFDTFGMHDDGPRWHPLLLARESPPAHWSMLDSWDRVVGTIDLCRTADGLRYRVEHRGELIGWATSLKIASERLHRVIISAAAPGGGVNGS